MPSPRKPTRRQELVAAITTHGAHLTLSKNTINALAKYAVSADEADVTALLNLISQPDPHRSLRLYLPSLIRNVHADWDNTTEDEFAQWVRDAALCFHQVDEYLNQHSSHHQRNHESDRLTQRFIQGMQHHHDENPNYTDEQVTDLAMISAAAHSAYFNEMDRTNKTPLPDINTRNACNHSWCHFVTSPEIIARATSSNEIAKRIIEIITDDGIGTEEHILYRLENGPRALSDGVI